MSVTLGTLRVKQTFMGKECMASPKNAYIGYKGLLLHV